jgi:hypothetical protein
MPFVQAAEVHRPFNILTHALWSILAADARPLLQIPYHLACPTTTTLPLHLSLPCINRPTG